MPLYDSNNKLIGTKIFYLNESTFGGHVPEWLAKAFVPKAVIDTYDALIKSAKDVII